MTFAVKGTIVGADLGLHFDFSREIVQASSRTSSFHPCTNRLTHTDSCTVLLIIVQARNYVARFKGPANFFCCLRRFETKRKANVVSLGSFLDFGLASYSKLRSEGSKPLYHGPEVVRTTESETN